MRNPINNEQLLKDSGLKVVHIRAHPLNPKRGRNVTVAYRRYNNSPLIEVATAITNPCDVFEKKVGTRNAITAFEEGKTFTLVDQWNSETTAYLKRVFG